METIIYLCNLIKFYMHNKNNLLNSFFFFHFLFHLFLSFLPRISIRIKIRIIIQNQSHPHCTLALALLLALACCMRGVVCVISDHACTPACSLVQCLACRDRIEHGDPPLRTAFGLALLSNRKNLSPQYSEEEVRNPLTCILSYPQSSLPPSLPPQFSPLPFLLVWQICPLPFYLWFEWKFRRIEQEPKPAQSTTHQLLHPLSLLPQLPLPWTDNRSWSKSSKAHQATWGWFNQSMKIRSKTSHPSPDGGRIRWVVSAALFSSLLSISIWSIWESVSSPPPPSFSNHNTICLSNQSVKSGHLSVSQIVSI